MNAMQIEPHPKRFIYNDTDLGKFLESPIKRELLTLISAMGRSCANPKCVNSYDPLAPLNGLSPSMAALHGSLSEMQEWSADFPPVKGDVRFGNPAFRSWHKRLVQRSVSIVSTILLVKKKYPESTEYSEEILLSASEEGRLAVGESTIIESLSSEKDRAVARELCSYLQSSFGHEVRLDYGTGHESSFQVFLFTLCKLGCFGSSQNEPPAASRLKAVTLSIWSAYLSITRVLQTEYMLEPAGSHGVWGLDDYHCLPFYFGACQLQADGDGSTPGSIHEKEELSQGSEAFLYYGCISYIQSLKKGVPFFESSPMLNDISRLPSWQKVASGLLKLYEGEVLKKRQVVQHFMFGEIFKADWIPSEIPKEAPTEAFRPQLHTESTEWAAGEPGRMDMAPTKAPWAK
jgi:hypothetical protein